MYRDVKFKSITNQILLTSKTIGQDAETRKHKKQVSSKCGSQRESFESHTPIWRSFRRFNVNFVSIVAISVSGRSLVKIVKTIQGNKWSLGELAVVVLNFVLGRFIEAEKSVGIKRLKIMESKSVKII